MSTDPYLDQLSVSPEDIYNYGDLDIQGALDLETGETMDAATLDMVAPGVAASATPAAPAAKAMDSAMAAYGTPEFEARRRAAFLDSPDSMAGIRSVRNMVGQAAGLTPEQTAKYKLSELEAMAKGGGALSPDQPVAAATGSLRSTTDAAADALSGRGALRGGASMAALQTPASMAVAGAPAQDAKFSASAPERLNQDMAMAAALAGGKGMADRRQPTLGERANDYLQHAFRGKIDLSQPVDTTPQAIELRTGEGELERRFASLAAAGFPVSAAQLPGAYLGTSVIGMPNQVAGNTRADLGFLSPEELAQHTVTTQARYPRF